MKKVTPSPHGRALGVALADLADAQAKLHPEIPERCKTCAFRHGTDANGYAPTLLEALRCVLGDDPAPFGCHCTIDDNVVPKCLCAGYVLCKGAPWDDVRAAVSEAAKGLDILKGATA